MPRKNSRTANGDGLIQHRQDGRWEARVSMGIDPATGKYVRKSIYGKTQKEVLKKKNEIVNALSKGIYQEPHKITVKEWFHEWVETFCKNRVKPYTYESYKGIIKNHIVSHIGAMQLTTVKGVHIQKMYNDLTEGGAAGKTVKNIGAIMHKAFSVAVKQGYIPANPCDAAELPAAPKKEIKPLSDNEIPVFMNAIQGEPLENAFALCLIAGLREGECLGLSWAQVDFDKQTITINQQLQRRKEKGGKYEIVKYTKNSRPRTIRPASVAFDYLHAELRRQNINKLKAGSAWGNDNELVFTNEIGEHIAIQTFYKSFKRIAASIGRPDARPHDLRHTAATVAIASGADVKSVQDLMGHASPGFTLSVYAHTSEKMMEDTAARMQGYFDSFNNQR